MSNEHAMYLSDDKTGVISLFAAKDVEKAKANGHSEPLGMRANGYVYNREEDQATTDAAAELQGVKSKRTEEKNAKKAKEAADARAASDKAQKDAEKNAPESQRPVIPTFRNPAETAETAESPSAFKS